MYFEVVSQCAQSLKHVETLLDKAEQFAAAKHFDVAVLLNGRLAPDMQPFIYQIQSACDYVKAAAAWLSGQKPPKHEDNEQTVDELRARVRKTIAFVESVAEARYEGASHRRVSLSWAPGKVLTHRDGLRGTSKRRRRCGQDGLPWSSKVHRRIKRQAWLRETARFGRLDG